MPTLIDSLLIALELDPSKFIKGQRDATESMGKTREAIVKNTRETEAVAKSLQDSVQSLTRNFIAFFAVVAGTSSLKSFVSDVVASDSALGRLAQTLGVAPSTLSSFAMAVERTGGSASEAMASFQSLNDSVNELVTTGSSAILPWLSKLQAASGVQISLNKGTKQTFLDIADALGTLKTKNPSLAGYLGNQLTHSANVTAFLEQGRAGVAASLAATQKYAATPEQIAANQSLLSSWTSLQQGVYSLGRDIETTLAPSVDHVVRKIQDWVDRNKEWLDQKIGDAFNALADAISDFASSPEFKSFVAAVSDPANWQPFTDFVKDMGKAETWKGFLAAVNRISAALQSVVNAIKTVKQFSDGLDNTSRNIDEAIFGKSAADWFWGPKQGGGDAGAGMGVGVGVGIRRGRGGGGGDAGAEGGNIFQRGYHWARRKLGIEPEKTSSISNAGGSGSLTKLINDIANQEGVDPRVLQGIRAGESGHGSHYDIGDVNDGGAYGPFQFNMGRGRFGDKFYRDTAFDPRDPKTIPAQIRYMAKFIKSQTDRDPNYAEGGNASALHAVWHGYHGRRDADPRWGDSGYVPDPSETIRVSKVPVVPPIKPGTELPAYHPEANRGLGGMAGAIAAMREAAQPIPAAYLHAAAVAGGAARIANDNRTSHSSSETNVGHITVNTQATDAHGIANSLRPILAGNTRTAGYNSGPK